MSPPVIVMKKNTKDHIFFHDLFNDGQVQFNHFLEDASSSLAKAFSISWRLMAIRSSLRLRASLTFCLRASA